MEFDISKIVEEIAIQATENQEEFIFETIRPYCENILQMKINKEELKQILLNGIRKQQPNEDYISRKSVVEWLERCTDDSIEHAIDSNLDFIPSVTPQPKIGRWIWEIDETPSTPVSPYELNYEGWVCSCCHQFPDDICEWDDLDEPPHINFALTVGQICRR